MITRPQTARGRRRAISQEMAKPEKVNKRKINNPPITLTSTVLLFVYAERLCRFQRNIFWRYSLVV